MNFLNKKLLLFFLFMGFITKSFPLSLGHWEIQYLPTKESFRAIQVYSSTEIWASGTHGTVAHSSNSGKSWELMQVPGAEDLDFRGLAVLGPNTLILISSGESEKGQTRIYRTENAGKTWDLVYKPSLAGIFLDNIRFWDRERGIIVGDPYHGHFFILKTQNGGKTWDTLKNLSMPGANPDEGAFAASNSSLSLFKNGKAWFGTGGERGARIFRTNNYGLDWEVSESPLRKGKSAGIFSLFFENQDLGYGCGGDYTRLKDSLDNFSITEDGGRTWMPKMNIPSGYMESLVSLGKGKILAIGPNGSSLGVEGGKSWKILDTHSFHALSKKEKSIWAIGPKGLLGHWVWE